MSMDLNEKLKLYRISTDEYALINQLLGRPPEGVEWALFSALWSEHCSYKSSRIHLKKFYSRSKHVLGGEGENAGIIDLGEDEKVAFKMESHNHPSFIEPYQGAATGVGGILRDIFTMGARPIALADYLCFGEPKADRMELLVDGVVRGIGGYGNSVGVPCVTGQTEFDPSYNGNILVNAMAVGLYRKDDPIFLSAAEGEGNLVVYVGAKTGKDGVHGASMASESFDEDSESKRPNVQIGDPFFEKLLIESCLEVMKQNLVVSIQDMGAAGLTSSSFEMASKGQVGMDLHLDQVPLRDPSMTPEEILLSESQERMLLIAKPENLEALQAVFHRWGLDAVPVGKVKTERKVSLWWKGEVLTSIDPDLLVENAPRYDRAYEPWKAKNKKSTEEEVLWETSQPKEVLNAWLQSVEGGSKKWIYQQYDQRVGHKTVHDANKSVAVLRLPDSGRGLAMTLGCRPYLMRMDAQLGAMDAVLFPALQLAARGAKALAVTDCLNFGNPEKPHVMSEFVASVEGISKVCEVLDTPVISGNVSFYNETLGKNVTSTPATGIVGVLDKIEAIPSQSFKEEQDVFLLSLPQVILNGAVAERNKNELKFTGEFKLEQLQSFINGVRELAPEAQTLEVVGKGGLLVQLARMSYEGFGLQASADFLEKRPLSQWFNEVLYEVVVAGKGLSEAQLMKHFDGKMQIQCHYLGKTQKDSSKFGTIELDCGVIKGISDSAWEKNFESLA